MNCRVSTPLEVTEDNLGWERSRLCHKNMKWNSGVTDYSLDDRGLIPSRNVDFPHRTTSDRLWNRPTYFPRRCGCGGMTLPTQFQLCSVKLLPVALVHREQYVYLISISNEQVPNLFVHKGGCQTVTVSLRRHRY
jgi:hypothetical protein